MLVREVRIGVLLAAIGQAKSAKRRMYRDGCIAQAQSPWRVFVREERETKTAKSRQWSSTIAGIAGP
jgi:hypothetical protein